MKRDALLSGMLVWCLCMAATAQASTTILGASQDAGAMNVYFSPQVNTNFGAAEWIHHYNHDYSQIDPRFPNYLKQDAFSYFQFDLSGLSSTGLVSATFNAYHRVSDYYNTDPTNARFYIMKAYQVTSAWDEDTLTYANQPTIGGQVGVSAFLAAPGVYMDDAWEFDDVVGMDLTTLVASWLDGSVSNYGFKYKMDNNFLSNGHANMVGTMENANELFRPSLTLVFKDNGATPVVPEPASMLLAGCGLAGLVRFRKRLCGL